jgi:hypothetical protein
MMGSTRLLTILCSKWRLHMAAFACEERRLTVGLVWPERCNGDCAYLYNQRSRVCLEKLTVAHLVQTDPVFYGTWGFVTLFTRPRFCPLPWASWTQSMISLPYFLKFYFNIIFLFRMYRCDRLCGLVIRVLSYRSGGPSSIPGTTRKKK